MEGKEEILIIKHNTLDLYDDALILKHKGLVLGL